MEEYSWIRELYLDQKNHELILMLHYQIQSDRGELVLVNEKKKKMTNRGVNTTMIGFL